MAVISIRRKESTESTERKGGGERQRMRDRRRTHENGSR